VFVFVAIDAQIFPIGAVSWIVPAISVLMVHGEQMPGFEIKLSSAFGADKPVNLQRLFPVIFGNRGIPR
jgi:hypothetical protein